jgi:electron transfer flavoprotein alpha subunit
MILVVASAAPSEGQARLAKSTYELVSAARQFDPADSLAILVLGHSLDALANEAALLADQVLVADHPAFAAFDPETWAAAVASIATQGEARLVLIAANRDGRAYSPRLAVRLNAPLLEDIITLTHETNPDQNTITAQRYSFLARATETLATTSAVAVATLQPGAFPAATPSTTHAEQYEVELTPTPARVRTSDRRTEASTRVSLADAEIVVAGGRGLGSAQAFDTLLVPIAETLNAAIGATRAVIDAGWRPYTDQVGQTGKTVQPKIYLALGISGAAQHLSGMNKSKLILAINKDPDAPIFTIADYGIVGDLNRILPALLDRLREP